MSSQFCCLQLERESCFRDGLKHCVGDLCIYFTNCLQNSYSLEMNFAQKCPLLWLSSSQKLECIRLRLLVFKQSF